MNKLRNFRLGIALFLLLQACNMPGGGPPVETEPPPTELPKTEEVVITAPTEVQHTVIPVSAPDSVPYPDVTSFDTAPEQRAPYGDSYDIYRLERPFTQDMTYIADLDISSFSISEEGDFYFISIGLIGVDPNNSAGIKYYLELDTDRDSFGDFLIVAERPYSEEWTAANIKVYSDTNQDSAGYSPSKSDAVFPGNGYDALIHDIEAGIGSDVDMVWVRINAGLYATVQFAVKKTFTGEKFLYSVMADAGLQDVARLDYIDYFTEEQAGSPIRSSRYYPLKELYAVDNTCYQAQGFTPTGYEPKICPIIVQPQKVKEPGAPPPPSTPGVDACTAIGSPNPGNCTYGWWDYPYCQCGIG